jgi:hypothetical protein
MHYLPPDKTMPARGTHSLDPSVRGRGLRFSGSWSKVASTQSAIALASSVMVAGEDCLQPWRGGGCSEEPERGCTRSRPRIVLSPATSTPASLSLPCHCRTRISTGATPYSCSRPVVFFFFPPCKRSVSHVHASAFRHLRGTAHGCPSAKEPPRKTTPSTTVRGMQG